jgi:hypothetical protein
MENQEKNHAGKKVPGMEQNQESGERIQHPGPENDDTSLPSDGPVSETEGDDRRPDLNNIKKNEDDEPGVPDQDF